MAGHISKQVCYILRSSDSSLSKAYGLPKIHKKNTPFRIIASLVNSTLHSFANFLQKICKRVYFYQRVTLKIVWSYRTLQGTKIPEKHILISI